MDDSVEIIFVIICRNRFSPVIIRDPADASESCFGESSSLFRQIFRKQGHLLFDLCLCQRRGPADQADRKAVILVPVRLHKCFCFTDPFLGPPLPLLIEACLVIPDLIQSEQVLFALHVPDYGFNSEIHVTGAFHCRILCFIRGTLFCCSALSCHRTFFYNNICCSALSCHGTFFYNNISCRAFNCRAFSSGTSGSRASGCRTVRCTFFHGPFRRGCFLFGRLRHRGALQGIRRACCVSVRFVRVGAGAGRRPYAAFGDSLVDGFPGDAVLVVIDLAYGHTVAVGSVPQPVRVTCEGLCVLHVVVICVDTGHGQDLFHIGSLRRRLSVSVADIQADLCPLSDDPGRWIRGIVIFVGNIEFSHQGRSGNAQASGNGDRFPAGSPEDRFVPAVVPFIEILEGFSAKAFHRIRLICVLRENARQIKPLGTGDGFR